MSAVRALARTAGAFLKKDLLVTVSYRFNFILQIALIFTVVAFLYFVEHFVGSQRIPFLEPYGGSYFGFLLIGMALGDYIGVSVNSFAHNIRDGQLTGTLELIQISPTPLPHFLVASSLWSFLFTTFRIGVYLLTGVLVFGLRVGEADLAAAGVILLLSILCYVGIGILLAALVLVVKRGEAAFNAVGGISLLVSGLLFPPDVLPQWMEKVAAWIPFTYSLHGMRMAILEGASLGDLSGDVARLALFALIFVGLGMTAFPYALKRAKQAGTLTQY